MTIAEGRADRGAGDHCAVLHVPTEAGRQRLPSIQIALPSLASFRLTPLTSAPVRSA